MVMRPLSFSPDGMIRTLKLCHVHPKLVPLLQHALAPLFNEGVELRCELGHAIAELVEAKVDAG